MKKFSSCIYSCNVVHKRLKPKKHFFKYKTFSLMIDLKELKELEKKVNFFSYNKFNILSFYDVDHGGRDGKNLGDWVKKNLVKSKVDIKDGKIKLLCYPRFFGYVFNPLSIFYCYNKKGRLKAILYEVKNTFNEQHTYIFKIKGPSYLTKHNCEKKLYVSPFIKMNTFYNFRLSKPGKNLNVLIKQNDINGTLLIASQSGKKIQLNSQNLLFQFLKNPLMSFKVIAAIHFEAARLWVKGVKLIIRKAKRKDTLSLEN